MHTLHRAILKPDPVEEEVDQTLAELPSYCWISGKNADSFKSKVWQRADQHMTKEVDNIDRLVYVFSPPWGVLDRDGEKDTDIAPSDAEIQHVASKMSETGKSHKCKTDPSAKISRFACIHTNFEQGHRWVQIICACVCVCACRCVHTCVCVYVCMFMCVCVCLCM
jgi:hypothetical protein